MICWFFKLFCIIFFYFPLIFSFSICCHSINSFTHREWFFKIEFSFWLLLLVLNWIKCEHLKNVPSLWFVLFFVCILFSWVTNPHEFASLKSFFFQVLFLFSLFSLAFFRSFSFDFMSNCSFLHALVLHTHSRTQRVCRCMYVSMWPVVVFAI